ncbi:protein translocase subunit yajC [Thermostaphylospora chromogena]|uniref:Protein translocase subunit yajC n=1 Tax=Thermostaphylospora chromogena TaxID=35622 RepID=A0A1H1HN46_9ACTN|nr:preprotein translocase subunit YajC [Thermostaphylospora chromogena]SDR26955.1 protein translocase subunit yajC [Thermostaphylospora chromogena]
MGSGDAFTSLVPLILLFVVFYFLIIRPQRKRQQEQIRMQNSLTPGSRVMTTTGLFANVVAIDGDDVILEIAPGVESRWVKAAIGRVVTPAAAPGGGESDERGDGGAEETGSERVDSTDGDGKETGGAKS